MLKPKNISKDDGNSKGKKEIKNDAMRVCIFLQFSRVFSKMSFELSKKRQIFTK